MKILELKSKTSGGKNQVKMTSASVTCGTVSSGLTYMY